MAIKKCFSCGIEKDTSEFNKDKYKKDGYYSYCMECTRIKQRVVRNKENNKQHRKVYRSTEKYKLLKRKINKKYAADHLEERLEKIQQHPEQMNMLNSRFIASKKLKLGILKRDNYCCQLCGNKEKLELHHIIPVKDIVDEEDILEANNTIILCKTCHLHKAHDGSYRKLSIEIQQILLEKVSFKIS